MKIKVFYELEVETWEWDLLAKLAGDLGYEDVNAILRSKGTEALLRAKEEYQEDDDRSRG